MESDGCQQASGSSWQGEWERGVPGAGLVGLKEAVGDGTVLELDAKRLEADRGWKASWSGSRASFCCLARVGGRSERERLASYTRRQTNSSYSPGSISE